MQYLGKLLVSDFCACKKFCYELLLATLAGVMPTSVMYVVLASVTSSGHPDRSDVFNGLVV